MMDCIKYERIDELVDSLIANKNWQFNPKERVCDCEYHAYVIMIEWTRFTYINNKRLLMYTAKHGYSEVALTRIHVKKLNDKILADKVSILDKVVEKDRNNG